ncbi:MAG: hypothetical protein NT154_48700 [Verrucomicrobia bacterium]|nr:hypothetical protein [Verrucomicrobiota bacterium]
MIRLPSPTARSPSAAAPSCAGTTTNASTSFSQAPFLVSASCTSASPRAANPRASNRLASASPCACLVPIYGLTPPPAAERIDLPFKWIAARVQIATAKGAKPVLHYLAQSQDQRKAAKALEPCAQLEFQSTV